MKLSKKIIFAGSIILFLGTIIWTTNASIDKNNYTLLTKKHLKAILPSPLDSIDDDTLRYPFQDYDNNPYNNDRYNSALYMKKPSIFSQETEYDPVTGKFVITQKVGNSRFRTPYVMDFDEYNNYQTQNSVRNYWREKMAFQSGSSNRNPLLDKYLNPKLNVGIKGFDKIFGSDEISITPNGAANLTFGLSYTKIDNPALPRKQQRHVNFTFDENIQMGVNGKIGEKMNIGINYNTEATFDFENKTKIEYVGDEDEIIQRIEAGNVTMPLENTLIPGSSTLFGLKTELQFGKLSVTSILSHQKGESETIEVEGGAVLNDYEILASDYEANKHFFLNHSFRDNYESSLQNLPAVTSSIKITRIEVWVTNKTSDFENSRNIVGFLDLGENKVIHADNFVSPNPNQRYPDNESNSLYNSMTNNYSGIRDITQASGILSGIADFTEGEDFIKLENARLLSQSNYTINESLGYISLNFTLRSGEVLAIAYEYVAGGETYQVGEFSNGDVQAPNSLILKLLKGPALTPALPNWDLMMKNIYTLNTYALSSEDFSLEIFYNNDKTGNPINYIPEGKIADKRLLKVMRLDNADNQLQANPDGFFDYIEGITVISQNGRIIFPVLEPFGKFLREEIGDQTIADKYVFEELYDSTQYKAQQLASKNKFYLFGSYRSSGGSVIQLNAMNIPEGAVKVTQGGVELTENSDFTVDYNMGTVTILNESLLMSGTPIKINVESNEMYGMKTKNLWGSHFNYQFNENFNIGSTVLHLTEKPLSYKTPIGDEPISNTIWGFNTHYSTEVPILTKMVDLLPFIETKAPSNFDYTGEFAYLIPGNPRVIDKAGVSFIDDFEDSQTYIDLKSPQAWVLSSAPRYQPNVFPEAEDVLTLAYGYNRANLSWYDISQDFQEERSQIRPSYMTDDDISNQLVRQVFEKEIFPDKESVQNIPTRLTVLNLAYYPDERGPYNFDVTGEPGISAGINEDGTLINPQSRWGGIMRDLYINDFESANIEFIEFWLMDPFVYDSTHTGGSLYLNLGDISEDILHDSRKSFENGVPYPMDETKIDTTQWGIVSKIQMTTQTFDNDVNGRLRQDAGLDGLLDAHEQTHFRNYINSVRDEFSSNSQAYLAIQNDPANDNFKFFLDEDYDAVEATILERYKKYNGMEGNSPPSNENGNNTYNAVSFYPDMEDVNRDNTLDDYEGYYQYQVELRPENMQVGQNYIVNKIDANIPTLPNGDKDARVTWYQFKIPIYEPDRVLGNIQGFKSIRFIRMFLRGFDSDIVLRFGKFNLVRGEWRKYQFTLTEGGEGGTTPQPDNYGNLDVSVVNIEESGQKTPVNYVLPPEVTREFSPYEQQLRQLNEQALSLKTNELPDGESKAIYKTVNMDFRKYKRLQMYIHAEALEGEENRLDDDDVCFFIRLGSDFTENYYEYEIPLKLTPHGFYASDDKNPEEPVREIVWPLDNELDLEFELLQLAKQKRNIAMRTPGSNVSTTTPYIDYDEVTDRKITILGNPNLSNVKTIMIGIRNPNQANNVRVDDGSPKSCEIWLNELRLADFNDKGGWAANSRISTNFADFASLTVAGYMHTPGYGGIEKKVNERYKDQTIEYDITSQVEFGKFFPKKYGVSVPLYAGFSESYSNPEYNPLDPDIKLKTTLRNENLSEEEKQAIIHRSQTFIQRKSINFTNIRMQGNTKKKKGDVKKRKRKKRIKAPYHISNFSTSFAYSEKFMRSPIIEYNIEQNLLTSFNYNYSPNAKNIKPFRKVKFLKAKPLQIIRDINFYYLPSRVGFSAEINRQYNTFKSRDLSFTGLDMPVSFQKNFLWQRNYDLTYKLTKDIKIDFTAVNQATLRPEGWQERETFFDKQGWSHPNDTIFLNLQDLGRNTQYNHQIRINWRTPIDKIPGLKWTSLTANYTGTYDWLRGQDPMDIMATDTTPAYTINYANIIQNAGTMRLNGRLDFKRLYTSVKYLKKVDSRFTKKGRKPVKREPKPVSFQKKIFKMEKDQPKYVWHKLKTETITEVIAIDENGNKVPGNFEVENENKIKFTPDTAANGIMITVKGTKERKENFLIVASDYTLKSMMALQNVSINYNENFGSLLGGYLPETSILGMESFNGLWTPGWEFISGMQNRKIAHIGAENHWLTTDTLFTDPFKLTNAREIRVRATVEPINNLKIDFNFQRSIAYEELQYGHATEAGMFVEETKLINGNYYISFNTIATAFERIDTSTAYQSNAYDNFLEYRDEIAIRLANNRQSVDPSYRMQMEPDTFGVYYPTGYSGTSQEVLIPAFLAAYSGFSPSKITLKSFLKMPLPDWNVTFDGLSNLPFLKDYVKKVIINHRYASTYTINNFQTNPNFNFDIYEQIGISPEMYQTSGMFIPHYEIGGITLSEKFIPFFGIDITWLGTLSTRFEYQKARELFLSFSNNQIKETHSRAFVIGAGYVFQEVPLNVKVGGEKQNFKSDLSLRMDLTIKKDFEIYRRIQEQISQLNTERKSFMLSTTADYTINERFDIQLFYNHTVMATNTAPKTTNIEGGFKIRFALIP